MLDTTTTTNEFLETEFNRALTYDAYTATGKPNQQEAFANVYEQATLTNAQRELLSSFVREMRVIVLSGMWCGDCVAQVPLIARIAEANPGKINVRYADRDEHAELSAKVKINEGARVPTALFMAEDHAFIHMLGDRTLSRYRAVAAKQLGASCEIPGAGVPDNEVAECLQDWINEFERVELLLRLSPRLRQKHND